MYAEYIILFNPGVHPAVASGATDTQIAHAKREHEVSTREFLLLKAVDNALKNQVVNAIDDIYIKDLQDRVTVFATRPVREVLQYLYQTYGSAMTVQLTANDERFRAPYDGSTDLEAYFNSIDDCLFMADKANQPYSEGQTLTAASSAITQSQPFPLAMQECHKLSAVARTWAAFKSTLLVEQKSKRDNGVAPTSAYAKNAHGGAAVEALNNLAAATTSDRQAADNQAEAVANLASVDQQLAHQLQQAQQQIQKMMENLHLPGTAHARSYQPQPQKPAPVAAHIPVTPASTLLNQGDPSRVRGNQPPRTVRRWDNENYCYSCGFDVAEWHTSHTCPQSCRRPDHNYHATRTNIMGGSEKHRALVGL